MDALPAGLRERIRTTCQRVGDYLFATRELRAGEYYGAIWSEKAYHGPLLDYHAGGSHHHRGAGSAGLVFQWLGTGDMARAAEDAFDWLAARQAPRGGYVEIQNNETPSDWERTGLEELSTIATGFVVHGLGTALRLGLRPKKAYMDCLLRAGHWQLSSEWPPGSGVFPHHERSPYNTLNANLHAAETLGLAFAVLADVYDRPLNIFFQGARRAVLRTLVCQWENGCFPYRENGGITINYTALVLWCLRNLLEALPADRRDRLAPPDDVARACERACAFLRACVRPDGRLDWEANETSTAKYNLWTYGITANVLLRAGGSADREAAIRLLEYMLSLKTASGLLPMRDRGEEITTCAFMQADLGLFLLPLVGEPG